MGSFVLVFLITDLDSTAIVENLKSGEHSYYYYCHSLCYWILRIFVNFIFGWR